MTDEPKDIPCSRLVKPAATGRERAEAIARIEELSKIVGARARADGLTEDKLQMILNQPD